MRGNVKSAAVALLEEIILSARALDRPIRLMEVCGTHTVSLRRHGIHSLLPANVELVSGPGCPVCVTPVGYVDNAIKLIESGLADIATFGDMVKVPGSDGRTLSQFLGSGRVHIVYSPSQLDGLSTETAKKGSCLVFLAIGFETTIPTILRALAGAIDKGDEALTFYTAFKLVPPALKALLSDDSHNIDGFILPGHASMIIGENAYSVLHEYDVPGTITGFEPLEMLRGIRTVLKSILRHGDPVTNEYSAVVRAEGNPLAKKLMEKMLEPCDAEWRGLGVIPASSLRLREEYARMDAVRSYDLQESTAQDPEGCKCGLIISGRASPTECPHFGTSCTPDRPIGPCMVSSEGTCAAYLKYGALKV